MEVNGDYELRFDLTSYGAMVTWTSTNMSEVFKDCMELDIENTFWYGGPEKAVQRWPIEKLTLNGSLPYVSRKDDNFAVAERYWLNSNGAYLFLDDEIPLFVDQNVEYKNRVCFIAKAQSPYVGRNRVRTFSISTIDFLLINLPSFHIPLLCANKNLYFSPVPDN